MVHAEPGDSWHLTTGAVVLTVWLVVGLLVATRMQLVAESGGA